MKSSIPSWKTLAGFFFALITVCSCDTSDGSAFDREAYIEQIQANPDFQSWAHYLGDPERTHFSLLSQIDTSNVKQLVPAWSYVSGEVSKKRTTQIQTNPLIVDNTLYGISPANDLFALNAGSGELIWEFSPPGTDQTGLGLSRGMVYWTDDKGEQARIFYASGYQLYAIDAQSGKRIIGFGKKGFVDLREGLGRDPEKVPIVMTTPGVIYKNLLITGHRTSESPGAAPGHIRAYDVISGELAWIFHTIPQPGDYGYETWPEKAYTTTGGANNWAGMALDETHGIVYVPTGSAAFDWYGATALGITFLQIA
ncbi:MAG: PQQ-binding-like beta-propeller repeat protein [Eudoraea sp.]|nr:PQQ-binding-like beta-propeller repeat protein [Eudoraea sp.]